MTDLLYFHFRTETEEGVVEDTIPPKQVIKVGRLHSSDVKLGSAGLDGDDLGVARMHAVIEQGQEGTRLIDLGTQVGSHLNGKHITRNAVMPKQGQLKFGRAVVDYQFSPESSVDWKNWDKDSNPEESAPKNLINDLLTGLFSSAKTKGDLHHKDLLDGLVRHLKNDSFLSLVPNDVQEALVDLEKSFPLLSASEKRKVLRSLVQLVRELRVLQQVMVQASQEVEEEFPCDYWMSTIEDVSVVEAEALMTDAAMEYHQLIACFSQMRDTHKLLKKERLPNAGTRLSIGLLKRLMTAHLAVATYATVVEGLPSEDTRAIIEKSFRNSTALLQRFTK